MARPRHVQTPPPQYSAQIPQDMSPAPASVHKLDVAYVESDQDAGAAPEVVPPGDADHSYKRRKASDGGEIVSHDDLHQRAKELSSRKIVLELRDKLQDKDQTVSRLRLERNKVKVKHQAELNKVVGKHLDATNKMEREILRLKTKENDLEIMINQKDQRILFLQERLNHLEIAYTRTPVGTHIPSLVPDRDPKIRHNPEYKHAEAPKLQQSYIFHRSETTYLLGEGKVWVSKYGSNKYWDLGLCRVRFEYGRTCFVSGCEYRHAPLTQDEQIYVGFLEPEGPKFLDLVRAKNIHHLDKVLEKPVGSAR